MTEIVRYILVRRREWIARRRRIVSGLSRAGVLIANAVRDGLYDEAWVDNSMKPLNGYRERYDDLTVETLDLFVPGEEGVAFWAAVEFYGAFRDPIARLAVEKTPRAGRPDGIPIVGLSSGLYLLPRTEMLLDWSIGRAVGPRYVDLFSDGDHARHNTVIPNSDVNVDLLRPPVWLDSTEYWTVPKKRPWHRPQVITGQGELHGM
ncbi:hypothetical protein [Salinibacterium sp. PAMC 21357]|uniref:hypothetical protein n=1 Tax=Salinibacterium sp. PAMC 21357 TaxID=1112215 RepID=UPI0011472ACD|nr:hypothetical protein [Salinibacterium sp. PAMC 21357]